MSESTKIRDSNSPASTPISEIDILWITAGLGCDGDTIAMTAATQPRIEDIVLGSMPWILKVHFHNPFLAMANGDDFLNPFHLAAEGSLAPFILVVEGSIPNENNKQEGYWASLGTDKKTGQPITTCEWIDRIAPLWFIHGVGFDITELKQLEEELQQERNVASAILHTVGSLVVVLDPQGRIVRFNRACEKVSGYSFAEVEGKYLWDLCVIPEEANVSN